MNILSIDNIYNAPVYHFDICESTMTEARALAKNGAVNGTVALAEYQNAGRGRLGERRWNVGKCEGLLFTIILRYVSFSDIPRAVTLRAGLAAALALEELHPPLAPFITVKWPNDIMLDGKKLCGILTESDGSTVYIGIGINVYQREFPPELNAVSIAMAMSAGKKPLNGGNNRFNGKIDDERRLLLETVLRRLHNVLKDDTDWRIGIEERLYKKGIYVQFMQTEGAVCGLLLGVDTDGALLIGTGGEAKRFVSGELVK
jgi:BirA family biotin operon repressor/biotin-[acetyl-CoA-carboxylase] ligase